LNRGEIDFASPGQLSKFLAAAAQTKVASESRRRLRTGKFAVHKERRIDEDADHPIPLTSPDPRPSQVAVANEWLENALRGRPPMHQQVLRLRAQGYTFVEIADQLGIDERSARRIVQRVEEELDLKHAGQ
jgi:DNA-directed RNA polymerase specialized sigma24 family protein